MIAKKKSNVLVDRLVRRLRTKSITRKEITRRIGVSSSTIHRWMTGQVKPTGVNKEMLRQVLDRLDRRLPESK